MERAALEPRAAPPARAARARLARAADRQQYGDRAHRVVRERPYELTSVFGVGFRSRTRSPAPAASAPDSPARTRAGVVHVLAEAERDGSTCLPVGRARRRGRRRCSAPGRRTPRCSPRWSDDDELVLEVDADRAVWAYRPEIAALEAELAEQVRALAGGKPWLAAPDRPADGRCSCRRPSSGPPCGPGSRRGSRSSRAVPARGRRRRSGCCAPRAAAQEASVALVAPTGRAARRMAESTGVEASTIHSALGWVPGQGPDARRARGRSADRRRDVDGEPGAARDAAARRRPAHARRARRRRRPARARRRRQAVRRAGRGAAPSPSRSSPTSSARRRGA